MKISLIIPTFNAGKYLPTLLENLSKQTVAFELIVIDSSSTDNTLQIAKKYTDNIITIPQCEFDHGGTRTKAAKTASGDIIVFLTQDALPSDKYTLAKLTEVFEDKTIAATYGRQLPYSNASLFAKHLRHFNYSGTSSLRTLKDKKDYGIKTAFLSDSFAAYRKSSLEKIGCFKNNLIVGEDTYAGAKLILKDFALFYNANAKVYHSHNYSPIEEFKRYFDIGVFHKQEHWILDTLGGAQGEGIKYIKSELHSLFIHHTYHKIPEFILRNGLKYIGYKLGYYHKTLPKSIPKKLSMHQSWWKTTL